MKEVIVNRLKIKCSKGRIEKGETVILSDAEIAKICRLRPDSVTVLRDIKPVAKPTTTKTRKPRNAKSSPLDKTI
jgi:hypothetical protein